MDIVEKIRVMDQEQQHKFQAVIAERGAEYGIWPLSTEQQSIWFLYQRDRGKRKNYYNMLFSVELRGTITAEVIREKTFAVVQHNGMLQMRFFELAGVPYQYRAREPVFSFRDLDLRGQSEAEQKSNLAQCQAQLTQFDLERGAAIQFACVCLAESSYRLIISLHHIAGDGYSMGLLTQQIADAVNGRPLVSKQKEYWDYVLLHHAEQKQMAHQACKDYWTRQLSEAPQLITLPRKPVQDGASTAVEGVSITLDRPLFLGILKRIRELKTSVHAFFLSFFHLALAEYGNSLEYTYGSPVLNRSDEAYLNVIGNFANMMILRVRANPLACYDDYIRDIQEQLLQGLSYMDIGIDEMLGCFEPIRKDGYRACYQMLYTVHKESVYAPKGAAGVDLQFCFDGEKQQGFDYDLSISIRQKQDSFELNLYYRSAFYEQERMQKLISDVRAKIQTYLDNSVCTVQSCMDQALYSEAPIVYPTERRQLIRTVQTQLYGDLGVQGYDAQLIGEQVLVLYYSGRLRKEPLMPAEGPVLIPCRLRALPLAASGEIDRTMIRLLNEERVADLEKSVAFVKRQFPGSHVTVVEVERPLKGETSVVLGPVAWYQQACPFSVERRSGRIVLYGGTSKKRYYHLLKTVPGLEYVDCQGLAPAACIDQIWEAYERCEQTPECGVLVALEDSLPIRREDIQQIPIGVQRIIWFQPEAVREERGLEELEARVTVVQGMLSLEQTAQELRAIQWSQVVRYVDGTRFVAVKTAQPRMESNHVVIIDKAMECEEAWAKIHTFQDTLNTAKITFSFAEQGGQIASATGAEQKIVTPLQEALLQVWRKHLGTAELGIYDKLFECGGNSQIALKILRDINDELHIDCVKITDLFSCSTVNALAQYIESKTKPGHETPLDGGAKVLHF